MNKKKLLVLLIMSILTFMGCTGADSTNSKDSNTNTEINMDVINDALSNNKGIITSLNNQKTEEPTELFDNSLIDQADYSFTDFNGKDIMLQPWVFLNFSISNVILHFQTIYDFSFEEGLFEDGWELVSTEGTVRNYEKILNDEYTQTIKVDIRDGVCYEFSFKEPYNYTVFTMSPRYWRSDAHVAFGKPSYYAIDGDDIVDYHVHPTGRYLIQFRYRQALEYNDISQARPDIVSIKYFDESVMPELDSLCMDKVTRLKEVY